MNAATANNALRAPTIDPVFATAAPVKVDGWAVLVGVGPTLPVTPAPEPAVAPEPDEPEPEPEPEPELDTALMLEVLLLPPEIAVPLATKPDEVLDDLPEEVVDEEELKKELLAHHRHELNQICQLTCSCSSDRREE